MTEFIYVKPAQDGRVRMPERASAVMPAEGALVPRIDYYNRLLLTGDIVEAEQPKPNETTKSPRK